MSHWSQIKSPVITKENLEAVLDNKVSFLSIEGFLDRRDCESLLRALSNGKLGGYDYNFDQELTPECEHYMTTHYLFEENSHKEVYFKEAKKSLEQYEELVKEAGVEAFGQLQSALRAAGYEVEEATENGYRYSSAMVRNLIEGASLHPDYAPFLAVDWAIKNIDRQLAWNIYLDMPAKGGETVVYNKPWIKEDDRFIKGSSYAYDPEVIASKERAAIKPKVGDLVIFNSRNFHEVSKGEGGRRWTMGGHLATTPEGKILSWV